VWIDTHYIGPVMATPSKRDVHNGNENEGSNPFWITIKSYLTYLRFRIKWRCESSQMGAHVPRLRRWTLAMFVRGFRLSSSPQGS
jgi:hypothetical protein